MVSREAGKGIITACLIWAYLCLRGRGPLLSCVTLFDFGRSRLTPIRAVWAAPIPSCRGAAATAMVYLGRRCSTG